MRDSEKPDSKDPGSELLRTMQNLEQMGLNRGKSGNASMRLGADAFLVSPSGIAPQELSSSSFVEMPLSGDSNRRGIQPSSEWLMHRDIYLARPDVSAIVHTHSTHATALACVNRSIPAFHYMIAVAGGDSIRCAPYATFGTQALSDFALEALVERRTCLLANHGVLALGASSESAALLALEVENLSEQYCTALQLGDPVILTTEQMAEVLEKFKTYGQRIE